MDSLKKIVAYKAVDEYVQSNMTIGLGTGSTVFYVLERIDNLLKSGKLKDVVCIPTSIDTELKARKLGIPLTTLEKHSNIDITIDGTDEIDLNLNLIKGRGGALVREKLVASSSSLFIIYDKSSPLIKLNYLFKVILRFTFLVSFSFLAIIVSTLYVENNIINKKLLQSFEITSLILSLLSFIILIRQNGTYILSKIKMYPFSFKDLIDVSLSTGVVTISVLDIFLCYLFLIVELLVFLIALFSLYECLDNPYMKDNENMNSFSLQFTSVSYIGLYIISQMIVFRSMPYHPTEYLGYIFKNIFEDIFCVMKKIWNFLF
ncbi:ribose 5-phosphate isomerase A [Plasmodium falciparum CAMP/Malaysia]|uniref:ribose-5-phosphate isomerase n=2 Tax=Plasmodium falciparum TaxID=5833 RepID=A0A024XCZ4_PLAFC|nr:ribose 5-phosphate isomerase A [Plasmodium falciparum CAMP/Malaysia]